MTPLQKAAQAVIDRWDSPAWKDQPHTAEYINELRKALDAEIAQTETVDRNLRVTEQSVEPFAWTGKGCGVMNSATKNRMIEDAKHGGEFASAARVAKSHDIPLYLHPPQPQATTPAAPTLTEALAQQGIKLRTEFEPKQRDHIEDSLGMVGERAELISRLAKQWAELDPVDPYRADIGQAVSMLEADAQQAKRVPPEESEDLYALALKADNWGQP